MGNKQKNVVLILTDQQRATEVFAEEAEGRLDLPAMRKLRRHGMSFANTVCNTCMCSPSRSTMFTGRYPAQHGVTQTLSYGGEYSVGQHSLDPSLPNMARMFARQGYDVQYRGKWHLSKSPTQPDYPNTLTSADVSLFGFMGWIPPDAGEDAEPEHFGGGWPNQDAVYIRQAIEYLQKRKDSNDDRPFLLVLSLVNPHDVLGYPNKWKYGYTRDDFSGRKLVLPPSVHEDLRTNHKPSAQWQLLEAMNVSLGALPDDNHKLNYLNFYGHLCEKIDQQIGQVLDLFFDGDEPNGFFDDTLIIRTADHGEMGMSHGGLRQKAFNVYEETMRVPMIWSNPEWFPSAQVTKSLMSLVDVMPTLASKVLELPKETAWESWFSGVDMSGIFEDPHASIQDEILFTFDDIRASSATQENVVYAPDRIRCIRTERWKYAEYFSADSSYDTQYEFYDLDWDANGKGFEYQNLYYDHEGYPHWTEAETALEALKAKLPALMANKLTLMPYDPDNPIELP